ncbi:TraR/DksA C4-type zinc finger protein [Microtetraspora sp. AC03309]|uniref:TraR/DksA family transcriptional regulator n=1 Tax=Microtetraspora sp. AC03309 TaxID=2779376 RepID=UPI001E4FBF53|nr:TraR/DksA C4-type zinc finger protein [Microtetraspora sp. AC03309]MCC5579565.1 TraR/DksA C4-type zinc finger protein [Microtetraspora sp. AC03309]
MDPATARMRLESLLDELDRSIGVLKEADPPDADRVQAVIDVESRHRVAVLAALRRLDDGAYGTCVDCGGLVPDGRLEARPEAARCVQCQSKRERRR